MSSEADADVLVNAIVTGSSDPWFDLDGNDNVDIGDLRDVLHAADRLNGDANFDGEVGFADFLQLADNFGTDAAWSGGDFNATGTVDFSDFLIVSDNFGKGTSAAAVPEPGTFQAWIGLMFTFAFWRRWASYHLLKLH